MKSITAVATAALTIVTLSGALTGCTPTTEQAYTGTAQNTPTIWTGAPAPGRVNESGNESGEGSEKPTEGANLHQYIVANKIAEIPFKKSDPGTPTIAFPFPPGWGSAGDKTPEWAYGAITYTKAPDPNDPPFMYAIGSKLTGNVDPEKILELAPGQLNELPQFKPREPARRAKVGGFDAVIYDGTFVWEGKPRAVAQATIVIPGKDALFVLQLDGEAPEGQEQPVIDAARIIREQTKIALPS